MIIRHQSLTFNAFSKYAVQESNPYGPGFPESNRNLSKGRNFSAL